MNTTTLKGYEAYAYAEKHNLSLTKAADPLSGKQEVSLQQAAEILKEDPSLLSLCIESDADYFVRLLMSKSIPPEGNIMFAGAQGASLDQIGSLMGEPRKVFLT